ncbi:hypothetical protein F511_25348 [Dorcoceras hygrometricum]|uniref:Uncharacterized protein n=1 Tax=Dorcoceras hygrometricum TaxID=472368 RepID=A0A2Z7CLV3_9LAMI|nr:hypothetical protein F511_25348 [Dorcoceras hygrometricum]
MICQRRQHYTQGRSDVNTTDWSTQMSTQRSLAMELVLQYYERQPEIPVLLIKPEQHPDSNSITDYRSQVQTLPFTSRRTL